MYDPRPVQSILEMAGKPLEEVNVVYLGTATYDIEQFQGRQTQRFVEMGCSVTSLKVTTDVPSNMFQLVDEADVIVVGGGNTLFAVDRWRLIGLDTALRTAMERGTIMTGGSAGAICWFDGGHSNSMDPDTYRDFRVRKFGKATQDLDNVVDEIYATSSEEIKDWKYIRISALGFLPGLVSPHHDRVQSNGVLRADDFDRLLLENPGELGIGIDHWAALVVDGMDYHVLSLKDREGSILNGTDFCTDGSGEPGIWIKEVVNGKVVQKVCPSEGRLMDLLRLPSKIIEDIQSVELCRRENRQPELASGPLIVG